MTHATCGVIKCHGTTIVTYTKLMLSHVDSNDSWHCLLCKIKFNHYNFPFTLCDDTEILNLNNSNSMRFCESLPKLQVMTEVNKFSIQLENELDYNLPVLSSCKYYSVNEVQNLKTQNNLNIFYLNINELDSKFDNL